MINREKQKNIVFDDCSEKYKIRRTSAMIERERERERDFSVPCLEDRAYRRWNNTFKHCAPSHLTISHVNNRTRAQVYARDYPKARARSRQEARGRSDDARKQQLMNREAWRLRKGSGKTWEAGSGPWKVGSELMAGAG